MWLLKNYKLVGCGIGLMIAFGFGWHVRGLISDGQIVSAVNRQIEQCNKDKQITWEADRAYQEKITTLSNRVAALKRVSTKCVPVTGTASGINAETRAGLPNSYGITSDTLIDYAADAEKQRQQLISLQEFVREVYKR